MTFEDFRQWLDINKKKLIFQTDSEEQENRETLS